MKTRLLWLFVLCAGLLLLMSLMVVGEEEPGQVRCENVRVVVPVSLKPAPAPEPEGQVADEASASGEPAASAEGPATRRLLQSAGIPYRVTAYYAFHPSDEAG